MTRKRLRSILMVCALDYGAAGLGAGWGLAAGYRVGWVGAGGALFGGVAVVLFAAEWLRLVVPGRFKTTRPIGAWVSLALGCYATALMFADTFYDYSGDSDFVTGVLLLVPFLLAISPLVRAAAWLGVAGSILFFAQCLAMLTYNGCWLDWGHGFFHGWIS